MRCILFFFRIFTFLRRHHSEESCIRRFSLLIVIIMLLGQGYGQEILWAVSGGGYLPDYGRDLAVDRFGNIYITGSFEDSIIFDGGQPTATTLYSAGSSDIFLARYSPDGMLVWAQRAGGPQFDEGVGVAVDSIGNPVITGNFHEMAIFGSEPGPIDTLVGRGGPEIFIAKYKPDGLLLWGQRAGGSGIDLGYDITTDISGNMIITGTFSDTAIFGAGGGGLDTLLSMGYEDIFIAKLASEGTLIWAQNAGGPGFDKGSGITTDADSNIALTGNFAQTAVFGAGQPGMTTLNSAGVHDIFLAKFTADGAIMWAESAGGTAYDAGNSVDTDRQGNLIITGEYVDVATFGAGQPGAVTLSNAGFNDMFLAKYAPDGTLLWAERGSGPGFDFGYSLSVDSLGKILVTGNFSISATFGIGQPGEITVTGMDSIEVFIAEYSSDGLLLWATSIIGPDLAYGFDVSYTPNHETIMIGSFINNLILGAGQPGAIILNSLGDSDFFLAKYRNLPNALNPAPAIPGIFKVEQNYPNPFNPVTQIRFSLPAAASVTIEVFNLLGQRIYFQETQPLPAGYHLFEWTGQTAAGQEVSSGVYFYKISDDKHVAVRKMILLR